MADWRSPLLIRLKETSVGDSHVGPSQTPRLAELADEFLYLGAQGSMTLSTPDPAIYRNSEYMRELVRRDENTGWRQYLGATPISAATLIATTRRPQGSRRRPPNCDGTSSQ
jgi:hypothetical protein